MSTSTNRPLGNIHDYTHHWYWDGPGRTMKLVQGIHNGAVVARLTVSDTSDGQKVLSDLCVDEDTRTASVCFEGNDEEVNWSAYMNLAEGVLGLKGKCGRFHVPHVRRS